MALTPEKLDYRNDEWLSLKDASALIGIDRSVAQRWIYSNKLPANRDKHGWWVKRTDAIKAKHLKAPSGRLRQQRNWMCNACNFKWHGSADSVNCVNCDSLDTIPVINENRIRGGRYMPYKGRTRWDTLANNLLRNMTNASESG